MISIAEFNGAIGAFMDVMGPPRLDLFIPGTPVPRPEGRPFRISAGSERRLSARTDPKGKDQLAKGRRWRRLEVWRDQIQRAVLDHYKGPVIDRPVVVFIDFMMPRPAARTKDAWVTVRPDGKNLVWALEDGLNPRYEMLRRSRGQKPVKIQTWRGLWTDDALATSWPVRRYADSPDKVGTRIRLWILEA